MIKIVKDCGCGEQELFDRVHPMNSVQAPVSEIIDKVKNEGDKALFELTEKFDGARLGALEVTNEEIEEALEQVDSEFLRIINSARDRIYAYHEKQKRSDFTISQEDGVVLGQKIIPIEKVGIYVPGGTAAYPSTVLMDAVPAKIAGCSEIIMTTPPSKDGKVNPVILAAAKAAGVDRIFKIGGAQAVAALAYGTESVPKTDKIVGPGNAYVAEAKKQVYGVVSVDMIAGPSEILIVADGTCTPKYVAADMLSQAEHDKMASAVLITDSETLANKVAEELEIQLSKLPREAIARVSIENNGKIIVTDSIDRAMELSNEWAPEHLEICVDNPFNYLSKVKHAGSVFMGKYCPEALGDYYAGPNHTLPTCGASRFSNPLSVDDFVKKTQFTYYTKEALSKVASDVAYFAGKEGLDAHARSVTVRMEEEK